MTLEVSEPSSLINVDDFRSLRVEFTLENVTTQTLLKNGKRFLGGREDFSSRSQDLSLRLVEIISTEAAPQFAIEMPHRNCAVGHHLRLSLRVTGPRSLDFKFDLPVRVRGVEPVDATRERITLSLLDASHAGWAHLLTIFAERQAASDELFTRMRGHA